MRNKKNDANGFYLCISDLVVDGVLMCTAGKRYRIQDAESGPGEAPAEVAGCNRRQSGFHSCSSFIPFCGRCRLGSGYSGCFCCGANDIFRTIRLWIGGGYTGSNEVFLKYPLPLRQCFFRLCRLVARIMGPVKEAGFCQKTDNHFRGEFCVLPST